MSALVLAAAVFFCTAAAEPACITGVCRPCTPADIGIEVCKTASHVQALQCPTEGAPGAFIACSAYTAAGFWQFLFLHLVILAISAVLFAVRKGYLIISWHGRLHVQFRAPSSF